MFSLIQRRSPAVFVGNAYRRQLFKPFLVSKTFGDRPHIYLFSSRVLKGSWFELFFYKMLTRWAKYLVVSDFEAPDVLKKLNPQKDKPIFWFGWNGSDEVADWTIDRVRGYPQIKMSFLFPEASQSAKERFHIETEDFKFPVIEKRRSCAHRKFTICYLSEVDAFLDLANDDKDLDRYLWDLVRRHERVVDIEDKTSSRKMSKGQLEFILKNRLRFHYVNLLKKEYGKQFVLVGNDWRKYGFDSWPSNYNPRKRHKLYRQSLLCLDLVCKSTDKALYPRSAEIISYSDGIIQLKSKDSESLFKDQTTARTFNNFEELKNKIHHFTTMHPEEFTMMGENLRSRLMLETNQYNRKYT